MKTFSIVTFGCRTNQAESRVIGEQLCKLGYKNLENRGNSVDLVVVNSCAITAKAEKEVRQTIRKIKRENPGCFLVVTGCWAEMAKGKKLKAKSENTKIDLIIKNKDKERAGEIIKREFSNLTMKQFNNEIVYQDKYSRSGKALVKIQDGCDNFCSYCIVPYLRGRSKSRPAEEVIAEINQLASKGIKEIVLTGTDMSSFKFKVQSSKFKTTTQSAKQNKYKNYLVKLLLLILTETTIKKISFGSINPEVFDEEFIGLYKGNQVNRLSSHFHIPLQSGCDSVLKRMNRKYRIKNYESAISNLKNKIPAFSFSTDIIIGFPGETEEEFNKSLNFLKSLKKKLGKSFTKIHIFRYSSRSGTTTAKMEGKNGWEKVCDKIKKQRCLLIKSLLASG